MRKETPYKRKIALGELSAKYRKYLPAIDLNTLMNLQEAVNSGHSVLDVISNPEMKITISSHLALDFIAMLLADYESPSII